MTAATTQTSPASASASAPSNPTPVPLSARFFTWIVWIVIAGLAVVAVYFGFYWWSYRLGTSFTEDAFVEAHIVNVAPEMVSGRIVRFLVEENDR